MEFSDLEVAEAVRAFKSSISKCEKAQAKLKKGCWQNTFVAEQLRAFYIAVALFGKEEAPEYTEAEREAAVKTFRLLIDKCENMRTKFVEGNPQRTLTDRRLKAFRIAVSLINRNQV